MDDEVVVGDTVTEWLAEQHDNERARFVLRYGHQFGRHLPLPDDVKRGKLGECFPTCMKQLWVPGNTLTYCEGFAWGDYYRPILHAWLCDTDDNVYDPTMEDCFDYFGMRFNTKWASKAAVKSRYYGLIAFNLDLDAEMPEGALA